MSDPTSSHKGADPVVVPLGRGAAHGGACGDRSLRCHRPCSVICQIHDFTGSVKTLQRKMRLWACGCRFKVLLKICKIGPISKASCPFWMAKWRLCKVSHWEIAPLWRLVVTSSRELRDDSTHGRLKNHTHSIIRTINKSEQGIKVNKYFVPSLSRLLLSFLSFL